MNKVPIEGRADLVKDLESGAILSKDRSGLSSRLAERDRVRTMARDHERLNELAIRVSELEAIIQRMVTSNG